MTTNLADFALVETLISASDVFQMLASERFHAGHWVFRGQSDSNWPLQPSIERFARLIFDLPGVIERYSVREFRRRAHHYADNLPDGDSLLEWLALMRHHGSPTRLLDFTKSPYVATFFACVDAHPTTPAAVWAINASQVKKHAAAILEGETLVPSIKELGRNCLGGQRFSDPEIFNLLSSGDGPMPEVVAPVEPFRFNQRMVLQQGLFLCPFWVGSGPGFSFERALANVLEHARANPDGTPPPFYKVVIEPAAYAQILRQLHRMNVNHASLFPDLDGLARSIANVAKIRATSNPPPLRPDWEFDMSF